MITITLEETQQILNLLKTLHAKLNEPWVKTYSGGKPNYTQPCERCGEVNPAEIHTCTPKREWVSLTDEEIELLCEQADHSSWKAIELTQARLKEKNL